MQISHMQNILFVTPVKVSFNFERGHDPQIKDCCSIHGIFFTLIIVTWLYMYMTIYCIYTQLYSYIHIKIICVYMYDYMYICIILYVFM